MAQHLRDKPVVETAKAVHKIRKLFLGGMALFLGFELLYAGMNVLMFLGVNIMALFFVLLGFLLLFTGFRMIFGKKKKPKVRKDGVVSSRPAAVPSFSFHETDHQHITGTGLQAEKRLEQLETLKGAGLIDDREYRQKRQEILKEL